MTRRTKLGALDHPLRVRILTTLAGRTASPSELAEEWSVSLGVASYHFKRLHKAGLLRLVRKVPRRGAVEHYYKANPQQVDALVDDLESVAKILTGGKT